MFYIKKIKKYLIVPFFTTDTFCHHFLKALTDALIVVSIFMTMNTLPTFMFLINIGTNFNV